MFLQINLGSHLIGNTHWFVGGEKQNSIQNKMSDKVTQRQTEKYMEKTYLIENLNLV